MVVMFKGIYGRVISFFSWSTLNIVFVSVLFLCGNTPSEPTTSTSFTLLGYVEGFPNNTFLYFDYKNEKGKNISDSVIVIDKKFSYHLNLPVSTQYLRVLLRTKGYTDFKFIWLEPKPMKIYAKKGDFAKATIIGSETQNNADLYHNSVRPYEISIDSINRLVHSSSSTDSALIKLSESLEKRRRKQIASFIVEFPNSVVSAYVLSVYSSLLGKNKTDTLFNRLSEDNRNNEFGQTIRKYLLLNRDLKIGDRVVDFSQRNTSGNLIKLSDYRGSVVLLEFWASWCQPCRKTNTELVNIYDEFHPKGFNILSVSLDTRRNRWLQAIREDSLRWENVSELNGDKNSACLVYGVNGIPDNFLIDVDGIIIGRNIRHEQLRSILKVALK